MEKESYLASFSVTIMPWVASHSCTLPCVHKSDRFVRKIAIVSGQTFKGSFGDVRLDTRGNALIRDLWVRGSQSIRQVAGRQLPGAESVLSFF